MRKNQLIQQLMLVTPFILISSFCFPQVIEKWVARYNGPGNRGDWANDIAVDAEGNVYVTGYDDRIGVPRYRGDDYLTIKYNKDGAELWTARYNGPADDGDEATAIAVDSLGNVYVTGRSMGTTGTGNWDYATIKYNAAGVEQWVARYTGIAKLEDYAEAIAVDAAGNVYVTGWSGWDPSSGRNTDYATIKYSPAGTQLWAVRYNGPGRSFDGAFALAIDRFSNLYVTGQSVGGTNIDFATVKYSTTGIQLWVARYNGPANGVDRANDVFVDDIGNVYVTGEATFLPGQFDYATIKYNSAGVLRWVARYDGPGSDDDHPQSLAVDRLGNVFVTGYSSGISNIDFTTVKYDKSGVEQWVSRFNGTFNGNDYGNSLTLDASGNLYVTGSGQNVDPNWNDYTTIKYNTNGVIQWLIEHNGPIFRSDDHSNAVVVDASGNVYVTGSSYVSLETHIDYVTIKYSQSGVFALKHAPPGKTEIGLPFAFLVSHIPNPASSVTRIQYELPFDGRLSIKVYDVLGREVATLVNEDKKVGYHNTDFNVSLLKNGLYYYRAILNGEKEIVAKSGTITVIK